MDITNHKDATQYEATDNFIITQIAKNHLLTTAGWARLLSITGFVMGLISCIGITVFFIFFKEMGPVYFSVGFGGLYLFLVCIIYMYPLVKLYRFSKLSTEACKNDNAFLLEQAFDQQKSLYKFIGIITIIFLVFNLLSLLLFIPFFEFLSFR